MASAIHGRLIRSPIAGIVPPRGGSENMQRGTAAALAVALAGTLLIGGCSSASKCPKPIAYDDNTLKEIQKALAALPKDNILRSIMMDYENERDDLRFCR